MCPCVSCELQTCHTSLSAFLRVFGVVGYPVLLDLSISNEVMSIPLMCML